MKQALTTKEIAAAKRAKFFESGDSWGKNLHEL